MLLIDYVSASGINTYIFKYYMNSVSFKEHGG